MGNIFLKLLNMGVTASWLVLAILLIRFVFRGMPKWIRCLLWTLVAIRLIVPFSIESTLSLQPSSEPIQSFSNIDGDIIQHVPSIDSNFTFVQDSVNPALRDAFAYKESESIAPIQVATEIAGVVWWVGMLFLIIFAAVGVFRLYFLVREAICYQENIYLCDAVTNPFILGIVKPKIFLPSTLKEAEMDYVIAHEKAHLQRLDHLWKAIGYLILCVYWFHPLLWVAYFSLCKDIELACDEKVIKNMSFPEKKQYSRILLSCATQKRFTFASPLAFGEVGVKQRVKTVLNHKKTTLGITVLAALVCVILGICFLTDPVKEYQIKITIPAESPMDFYYSDEEICPKSNRITVAKGGRLGDTEVILLPVEATLKLAMSGEENAGTGGENAGTGGENAGTGEGNAATGEEIIPGNAIYITAVAPAKIDVEKGTVYKIGVKMQNSTAEDIEVYVTADNVDVRIASHAENTYTSNEKIADSQNDAEHMELVPQGEDSGEKNTIYAETIGKLQDNELYAIIKTNASHGVLLVSSETYLDAYYHQIAISCDVYYPGNGGVKKLGSIQSLGSAYPITYDVNGIYVASGHNLERYEVDEENGTLKLAEGVCEEFDEEGTVTYTMKQGDDTKNISEEEYISFWEKYENSTVTTFSH